MYPVNQIPPICDPRGKPLPPRTPVAPYGYQQFTASYVPAPNGHLKEMALYLLDLNKQVHAGLTQLIQILDTPIQPVTLYPLAPSTFTQPARQPFTQTPINPHRSVPKPQPVDSPSSSQHASPLTESGTQTCVKKRKFTKQECSYIQQQISSAPPKELESPGRLARWIVHQKGANDVLQNRNETGVRNHLTHVKAYCICHKIWDSRKTKKISSNIQELPGCPLPSASLPGSISSEEHIPSSNKEGTSSSVNENSSAQAPPAFLSDPPDTGPSETDDIWSDCVVPWPW